VSNSVGSTELRLVDVCRASGRDVVGPTQSDDVIVLCVAATDDVASPA